MLNTIRIKRNTITVDLVFLTMPGVLGRIWMISTMTSLITTGTPMNITMNVMIKLIYILSQLIVLKVVIGRCRISGTTQMI